jgi:predicted enzyme related to lactoylglutathione lyase
VHVEIPVTNMDRALRFYSGVLGLDFERRKVDGYDMAFATRWAGATGASLALACGDVYVPGKSGPILYLDVADIDAVLARAEAAGGRILYPKTHAGEAGFIAEIEDSEGNRMGLSAEAG